MNGEPGEGEHEPRMGYTRGIVVQYQYQGAGIGIVLVVVKKHLYPITDQYHSFTSNAAIITKRNIFPSAVHAVP